jgi:hypothetical protein
VVASNMCQSLRNAGKPLSSLSSYSTHTGLGHF